MNIGFDELIRNRLMADKESAMISSKLLAKEYFPKVREAIKNRDVPRFSKICKAAGIPDKTCKILTSTFLQYATFNAEEDGAWWEW